jgi:hypothetical protein
MPERCHADRAQFRSQALALRAGHRKLPQAPDREIDTVQKALGALSLSGAIEAHAAQRSSGNFGRRTTRKLTAHPTLPAETSAAASMVGISACLRLASSAAASSSEMVPDAGCLPFGRHEGGLHRHQGVDI